jgi:signal transduction histidine kinase
LFGVPLDDAFMGTLLHGDTLGIRLGFKADEIANNNIAKADWTAVSVSSAVITGLWYEVSRDGATIEAGGRGKMILFILAVLIVVGASGGYILGQLRRDIVQPIETIFDVIRLERLGEAAIVLPDNELGELGRALVYQKAQLAEKNLAMKNMTSQILRETSMIKVLSHDLSTPISIITMSAQLLRDESLPKDVAQTSVRRILAQTQIVNAVLSHVKDMKSLESGKRRLELREMRFGAVMDELAAMFQDRLNSKDLKIEWNQGDRDVSLVADAISLRVSVLSNIISNAIKFSSRGGKIDIRCREVDGLTRIDIRDYGPGMPDEIRENLFSSEYATNRAGTEGESGTGFGMPLVKFYMDLYGGSVEVASKTKDKSPTDHGTTVSIILSSKLNERADAAA